MVDKIKIYNIIRSISLLGLFVTLLILFPINTEAQRLIATTDKQTVAVGEYFQITWELQEDEGQLSLPKLGNEFEVVQGPMRSSNYTMSNGKTSSSFSESYVMIAKKEGTYTIQPATANGRKKQVKSNPLTIKVVKGNANNANSRGGGNGNNQQTSDAEYFIKAELSKSSVYIGEPVTVSYTFYLHNAGLEQFAPHKMPQFNGFWQKDLPNSTDKSFREAVINGKKYNIAVIKKAILYPQRDGKLAIDPFEADAIITLVSKRRVSNPFFDDPFFSQIDDMFQSQQAFKKTLASDKIFLNVKPLPENNKPADFSGLVGKFKIDTRVNKTKIKANDALTYTVTISGDGNIQQVQPFSLNLPPDWDVYDPKTLDKPGSRTFEYTIVPKTEGQYTLPSIPFSYFDIQLRDYKIINSREIPITIEPGVGGSTPKSAVSKLNKEEVKLVGKDIRYIKNASTEFNNTPTSFYGSAGFYSLTAFPILAFLGLVIIRKKNESERADVLNYRKKSATGIARKRLKKARQLMEKNNRAEFYKEILQSTYGYLSDTLSLQVADINKESLRMALRSAKINEDTINSTLKTLDDFELAAYAPSLGNNDLTAVYKDAEVLINKLEGGVKNG